MNSISKANGFLPRLGLLVVLLAVLGLAGCGPEDGSDPSSGKQPPAQTEPAPPVTVDTVEFKPDTSDEFQRIHRHLPDGTKVSMRIDYRDGSSREEFYRPDGTVKEMKEFHAVVDKLKSVTKFDAKGEPVSRESYRINGVLESETEFLQDSSKKVTTYRMDGKRLHSVSIEREDGTTSTTYYRRDGKTLWAKAEWANAREVVVEYFDDKGVHVQTREVDSNNRDITVFDPTGKALYKQHWDGYWNPTSTYYYYQSYQLETVEEFEDDGVTLKRRIHLERYSNNRVTKVEYFEDGNLVREQELNRNGSVSSDKTLKDDGTWETNSNPLSDLKPDPIDSDRFDEPSYQDPLVNAPNNFL